MEILVWSSLLFCLLILLVKKSKETVDELTFPKPQASPKLSGFVAQGSADTGLARVSAFSWCSAGG